MKSYIIGDKNNKMSLEAMNRCAKSFGHPLEIFQQTSPNTLKKHLIDAPDPLVPYKTLRLKPTAASLSKTPTDNKDYTASLTFVVMGEDI